MPSPTTSRAPVNGGNLVYDTGDPRVLAWVSSPWSFSTTSYSIETPSGLVLIDTQFLPKEALQFVDDVEKATGKKAVLAVVLHANPDKFNGTAALQARGIRVVTSAQVAALIPSVHEKRWRAFGERYAPDYPREAAKPEVFGDVDTTIDGVTLHVLGPGCSEAHVVAQFEDDVFVGDLVANGAHSWLELGETPEWGRRLEDIRAMDPARIYPGRGLPGGPMLLAAEHAYLDAVIADVADAEPHGEPDPAAIARIKKRLISRFPSLRFAVFLDIGLPAEWKRQAAEAP
jgi:glyoxylase-like metal-dependent hydrolase (beta-lactamase superfamily II)